MIADPRHDQDPELNVEIPRLEPDYSSSPFATGPGIVPPTVPVNNAPFLTKKPEPVLGPEHAPFHPTKSDATPQEPTQYVDVPAVSAPPDRWGIPVTERPPGYIAGGRGYALVRALQGTAAGLMVGLLTAAGIAATLAYWHRDLLVLTVLIGLAVGWVVPLAWGRSGVRPGTAAMLIAGIAVAATVVIAHGLIESDRSDADFMAVVTEVWAAPGQFVSDFIESQLAITWYLVLAMLGAFVQAARPRRLG